MAEPVLGPEGVFRVKRILSPSVLTPLPEEDVPITSFQKVIATSGSVELKWICAAAIFGAPGDGGCASAERAATRQAAIRRDSGMGSMAVRVTGSSYSGQRDRWSLSVRNAQRIS